MKRLFPYVAMTGLLVMASVLATILKLHGLSLACIVLSAACLLFIGRWLDRNI